MKLGIYQPLEEGGKPEHNLDCAKGIIKQALKYRTSQWWQPKAGIILSSVYFSVLVNKVSYVNLLLYFIPAVTTILGIGIWGYFINDFFDRGYDKSAGKSNMLQGKSSLFLVFFFLAALSVAILPWGVLPYDLLSICVLVAEFLLLVVYAAPPFRLKERGFMALLADALYAYVLPFVLAFHTFALLGNGETAVLWSFYAGVFLWLFPVGVYNLAVHQIEDYDNDIKSSVSTWATSIGKEEARAFVLTYIWPAKILGFIGFASAVFWHDKVAGSILYILICVKIFRTCRLGWATHLDNGTNDYFQRINFHYHLWLPYLVLVILAIDNYLFLIVLLLHYLLFHYGILIVGWQKWLKPFLSNCVNYSIYYLFLLFGVNLKKENKSAMEYLKAKFS